MKRNTNMYLISLLYFSILLILRKNSVDCTFRVQILSMFYSPLESTKTKGNFTFLLIVFSCLNIKIVIIDYFFKSIVWIYFHKSNLILKNARTELLLSVDSVDNKQN